MGSYKWAYKSPNPLIWVIAIVTLLITSLITTHEPPSTVQAIKLGMTRILSDTERRKIYDTFGVDLGSESSAGSMLTGS